MENAANPRYQDEQDSGQENRKKGSLRQNIDSIRSAVNDTKKIYKYAKKVLNRMNPAIILVIILIVIFLFFFLNPSSLPLGGGNSTSAPGSGAPGPALIPGVTVTLTGPPSINNGIDITYTVSITYDPSTAKTPIEDIELYDTIPAGTRFGSTSGVEAADSSTSVVVWSLKDAVNQKPFTITLHTDITDTNITNSVYARTVSGASNSNIPPSTDNCSGLYDLINFEPNPLNANFGDPTCDFNRNDLYTLLKQLDPANADGWYYSLVSCETGGTYYPNAYNPISTSGSAWGMFQMGHEEYPALGISRQMNNPFDRGDVAWRVQASNAVSYNQQRGNDFAYWGCKP